MEKIIKHYGILGMKWGRRKNPGSQDHERASSIQKKKLHDMSDEDLKFITKRMTLVRDLRKTRLFSKKPLKDMSNEDLSNELNREKLKKASWQRGTRLKKRISQMSDAEVKKALARVDLERPYRDLKREEFLNTVKLVNFILNL